MSTHHSDERRKAIKRADLAVERIGRCAELHSEARIVAEVAHNPFYNDAEAWDSVQAVEELVIRHGLVSPEQWAADVESWRVQNKAELDAFLAELFPEKCPE